VLLTLAFAPAVANAAPTISVLVDRLCLIADGKVPVVGGGLLEQQEIYSGPLLAFSKTANVDIHASEGTVGGEPTRTLARSLGTLNVDGFELFSVAEFNFPGVEDSLDVTIWDPGKSPTHVAKGRLRWVFRSNGNTTARFDFGNHGLQGFVEAELVNETLGVVLASFLHSNVVFPQQTIDNIPIIAGHRYSLTARVGESHQQDDDEAFVRFTFNGGVTLVGTGTGVREKSCWDWAATSDFVVK
jgi:hypothetical protein